MHGAPSVSYPAGRSRFAACVLAAAWVLGCIAGALWWHHSPGMWRMVVMLAALVSTGMFAAWSWWRLPRGVLDWDGESWSWSVQPNGAQGRLDVALDLQHSLLLRWTAGSASRWLWLARADRLERWDDLRRAVYSRARPQVLQPGGSPAATP